VELVPSVGMIMRMQQQASLVRLGSLCLSLVTVGALGCGDGADGGGAPMTTGEMGVGGNAGSTSTGGMAGVSTAGSGRTGSGTGGSSAGSGGSGGGMAEMDAST